MALQQDHKNRTRTAAPITPLSAFIAGIAMALAFVAIQSPFF